MTPSEWLSAVATENLAYSWIIQTVMEAIIPVEKRVGGWGGVGGVISRAQRRTMGFRFTIKKSGSIHNISWSKSQVIGEAAQPRQREGMIVSSGWTLKNCAALWVWHRFCHYDTDTNCKLVARCLGCHACKYHVILYRLEDPTHWI